MKKLLFVVVLIATVFIQKGHAQTSKSSVLSPLLETYYGIKNALVNSDGTIAAARAAEFVKQVNSIDSKALSETDKAAFLPVKEKLATDAEDISKTKDLAKQRQQFSKFSVNFYTLAKGARLSDQPVYYAYCPMKKSYWLSSQAAIKNPYYGKQMLTCGTNIDTIK